MATDECAHGEVNGRFVIPPRCSSLVWVELGHCGCGFGGGLAEVFLEEHAAQVRVFPTLRGEAAKNGAPELSVRFSSRTVRFAKERVLRAVSDWFKQGCGLLIV